ncbi:TPA: hypothetical protein NGR52_004223 [Vibrio parahaemolyticus]|nr:hypothetical protein [Vibrio parahaemolyticus]
MSKKVTDNQIGKWFEKEVMDLLKTHAETHPIYYHRLLDSHAAGRLVSTQLTDLIVITPRVGTSFLELKASMKYKSASEAGKSLFRPAQIGKARMLVRAGQIPYCLFYDGEDDYVELWEIPVLLDKRPKEKTRPIFRTRLHNLVEYLFEVLV